MNVLDLLLAADLALDGDDVIVAAVLQTCNESGEVNVTLAKGSFLTKGVTCIGIYAVLCVYVANVLTNEEQSINGVCLAVKNEVCGVKVYTEVVKTNVFNRTCESEGSFLTGFEEEVLTVLLAVVSDQIGRASCRERVCLSV